ncbi:MAG: helix-turn-helix domain-containing protein [Cyanobacteriota bacterium]
MNSCWVCCGTEYDFSYQHLHGVMLGNLNYIAREFDLSHAEYHILGVLIGFWNKKLEKSYPTTIMLAKYACMSHTTVKKCLLNLSDKGLLEILRPLKTKRYQYILNLNMFLNFQQKLSKLPFKHSFGFSCSKKHDKKQIE